MQFIIRFFNRKYKLYKKGNRTKNRYQRKKTIIKNNKFPQIKNIIYTEN